MEQKYIDVVIPCAGTAEYFEEAIDSVLKQTLLPVKIYIVDNACSHDKYELICSSKNSALIDYIKLPRRISAVENWQYCLSVGASEYFAFLHDDDVWTSSYLEEALSRISSTKQIVLTAHYFFNDKFVLNEIPLDSLQEKEKAFSELQSKPKTIASFILSTANTAHMSALVFKRACIGFSINSKWMPDQTFFASYLMMTEFALVDKVHAFIRLSGNNGTSKVKNMGFISVETIMHLRNVTEVYIRTRGLTAANLMSHLDSSNKGYVHRLKQACFSWPLNPILVKFGYQFLSEEVSLVKKRKGNRVVMLFTCIYWILASLYADFCYFYRDFFSKNKIQ